MNEQTTETRDPKGFHGTRDSQKSVGSAGFAKDF